MAKGKGKLKAALSSQQTRLKKQQEALHAEHVEKAKQSARTKGKAKAPPPKPTIPFDPTDRILLIGEGNFSFARALASDPPSGLEYLPPGNVTATAYDSEDECYTKYPEAQEIVGTLRQKGVSVLFNVDATKLERCTALKGTEWDKIVWNFPHAGMAHCIPFRDSSLMAHRTLLTGKGIADQDRNILSNQVLILDFLRSAAPLLATGPIPVIMKPRKRKANFDEDEDDAPGDAESNTMEETSASAVSPRGSILITLRNVPPYTLW